MTPYLIYISEVSICLALFYLVYILLLRTDTHYKLKRFYLLVSIVFSFVIPQLPSVQIVSDFESDIITQNNLQEEISNYKDTFEKVVFGNIPDQMGENHIQNKNYILLILSIFYLIGVIYFLVKLGVNILSIRKLVLANPHEKQRSFIKVSLPEGYSNFSFFNYVFIAKNNLTQAEEEDIQFHELEHFKQLHSIDIIAIELVKAALWFNPIVWLIKKSMVKNHECLADKAVIQESTSDKDAYSSLLVNQFLDNVNIKLTHPFSYSLIKYRIHMMTKRNSKSWSRLKVLVVLPVLVVVFFAFANSNVAIENAIAIDDADEMMELEPKGMVFIPMGSFELTRTNGETKKVFNVSIDAFWMRETEVTVKEYQQYLSALKSDSSVTVYQNALPSEEKAPFDGYYSDKKYKNYPIVGISLLQAHKYCTWLTATENLARQQAGKDFLHEYRIPTDVEWVYASLGGMDPGMAEKPEISDLAKVGSKKPNEWGLWNMYDNVSEWTFTAYEKEKHMLELKNDPTSFEEQVVVMGNNYQEELEDERTILKANQPYNYVGFRYVRSYKGK